MKTLFRLLAFVAAIFLPVLAVAQPTITTHPAGATRSAGSSVSMSVAATASSGSLSYQWKKGTTTLSNSLLVTGATSAALNLLSVQSSDAGSYSVIVTDANGSVESNAAALTVSNDPPAILAQSSPVVLGQNGGTARLFVSYSASNPVTIQWRRNGVALPAPFYGSAVNDFTNLTSNDFGTYTVQITNAFGSVTSAPILLRQAGNYDPLFSLSPQNPAPAVNATFGAAFSPSRYIAVGGNGQILTSTDLGLTWTSQRTGFAAALNAALYDSVNGQFLYGGGFTQVATSSDGTTWTSRAPVGVNGAFVGLASNGAFGAANRIVGVGGDFAVRPVAPFVRVSSDGGVTWAAPTTAPIGTQTLNSVAYGAGRFVAVGNGGTIFTSADDGATWTAATTSPVAFSNFNRVVFANGRFIVVGNAANSTSSALLFTSDDGVTFTGRTSNSTGRNLLSVAHVSGTGGTAKWVAGSAAVSISSSPALANLLVSTDNGTTWTRSDAPTPVGVSLNEISVASGLIPRLFVFGSAGYIGRTDDLAGFPGTGITAVSTSVHSAYVDFYNDAIFDAPSAQIIVVGGSGNILTAGADLQPTRRAAISSLGFATAVARFNNRLLVAGSARIAHSDDNGATWTEPGTNVSSGNGLRGLAATPSLAVAVGVNGSIITSTDGATWTARTSGTTSVLQKVAHANGRWVAVGGNDTGATSIVILTSDNGTDWTARTPGTTGQLWGVDYGNGSWIAVGSETATGGNAFMLRSRDNGVTWERRSIPGAGFLYKVRYLHGVWYAVGASSVLAYSRDDGENWHYLPLNARPNPQTFRGIAIGHGRAFVVGNESAILASDPETSPTIFAQPSPFFSVEVGAKIDLRVQAANALQATYQWRRNGVALTDGPGVSGATQPVLQLTSVALTSAGAYDVVVTNSTGASVTSTTSRVVVSSVQNDTFPNFVFRNPTPSGGSLYSVIFAQNRFVAVGTGGRVITSVDGESWTAGAEIPFERARAIVFNGTEYLVAGASGRIYVTSSPETGPWTQRATSQPAAGWFNGLAFSGSTYVAVGDSGLIFSSTDGGATWATRTSPVANANYRAVAAKAGRFVAVGINGVAITSTDGVTWASLTLPTTPYNYTAQFFNSVSVVNNVFVITGNGGALLSSSDGVTWTAYTTGTGHALMAAAFDGTNYFLVTAGSRTLRSSNFVTWTEVVVPSALQFVPLNAMAVGASGRLVQVGQGGEIWVSTDGGTSWVQRGNQGGTYRLSTVRYLDDEFVAVGSGGNVLVSSDGKNWRRFDPRHGATLSGFAEGAGRVVLTTEFGDLVSVAGSLPTTHTVGDNVRNNGVIFANDRFVVVADGGRTRTSTDGTNWTTHTATGLTQSLNSVTFFAGVYVAAGQSGVIATSTDGAVWTTRTSGSTQTLHRLRAIDGALFALGDNRTLLVSTDAVTWNPIAVPNNYNLYGYSFRDIAKLHDGYYIASSQGQLVKTTNFQTWTQAAQLAFKEDLASIDTGGGRVIVSGFDGGALLSSAIPVPANATPVIAVQPSPLRTAPGTTAILNVVAGSTSSLSFKWFRNGLEVPGATSATLVIPNVTADATGSYSVVVSAVGGGSVVSQPAALVISSTDVAALIVDQPSPVRAVAGGPAVFAVGALSTTSTQLSYQWRRDSTPIAGATTATYSIPRLTGTDAATYDVVVTRGTESVTSAAANLTVLTPDNILWQQLGDNTTEASPARTVHDGNGKVYVPWTVQDRITDVAAGKLIGGLARFHEATGELDPTFRLDLRARSVHHAVVLPPANPRKLILAIRVGDANTLVRVDETGAIDPTFNAPLFARTIRFFAVQPDGKIIVPVTENAVAAPVPGALSADSARVYRLNADGSQDNSYTPAALTNANGGTVNLFGPPVVGANNLVYLSGVFTAVNGTARTNMARLTGTGALDTAFAASLPAGFFSNQSRSVTLQGDGRAVFVGDFRYTGRGASTDPIMAIRFNVDGSFDSTFAMPLRSQLGIDTTISSRLRHIVRLDDDSLVVGSDRLMRLRPDGTLDATFSSRTFSREAFWFSRGSDGRFYVPDVTRVAGLVTPQPVWQSGIARFNSDGTPDSGFRTGGWGRVAYVNSGAVLSDGRAWVGGTFNRYGSAFVPGVAQFSAAGALTGTQATFTRAQTAGFVAGTDNDKVFAWLETAPNSTETSLSSLVRLNADATVDSSFTPAAGVIGALHASPGGKVLLAQSFVTATAALGGSAGNALRRLNADGTLDSTYTASLTSIATVERNTTTNAVTMIRTGGLNVAQVLPDSRVLIIASSIDGTLKVQRLTATGAVDTTFTTPSFGTITGSTGFTPAGTSDPVTNTSGQFPITSYSASDLVRGAVQLPNGKVYVGGRFALPGSPVGLVRLNADGSLDTTFTGSGIAFGEDYGHAYVSALAVDSLGRLYVGGRFTSFNGVNFPGLFRLNVDGSLDTTWQPGFGILDVPVATVRFEVSGTKLYAFGTAGNANDPLPTPFRVADISAAPAVPTLAAVAPVSAPPLASVTLSGTNLSTVTAVDFTGASGPVAATFTYNTGNQTITATVPAAARNGAVTISGPGGSAALNVTVPLGLTAFSQHSVVTPGQAANLSVTVGGGAPSATYTYQWRRAGQPLSGATQSFYYVPTMSSAAVGDYDVVIGDGSASLTSPPVALRTATPDQWVWRNRLPTGSDLLSVAFGAGRYVAVGRAGTILTSTDGSTWTAQPSIPPLGFNRIVWNGSLFLAAGFGGNVFTSPDGLAWTQRVFPGPITLIGIAYGHGKWVVTGAGGSIYTSPDAVAWTRQTTPNTETISGVAVTATGFVAVSSGGYVLTTDTAATTWTATRPAIVSGNAVNLNDVAVRNGIMVAAGARHVFVHNGTSWLNVSPLPTSDPGIDWTNIVANTDGFTVVGGSFAGTTGVITPQGYVIRSADGANWTLASVAPGLGLNGAASGPSGYVAVGVLGQLSRADSFTAAWTSRATGFTTPGDLYAGASSSSGTILVGVAGNVARSTNHVDGWSTHNIGTTHVLAAAAFAAGKFVVGGGNNNTTTPAAAIYTSTTGASGSWTRTDLSGSWALTAVAYDPFLARFVASGFGGQIYTATDPAGTWTAVNKPANVAINAGAAGGGNFVLVGDNGTIFRSTDGQNWTQPASGTGVQLLAVAYGNNRFVAAGFSNANNVPRTTFLVSNDGGATWTNAPVPYTGSIRGMTFADGRFWTVGGTMTILSSPDGFDWTAATSQFSNLYRGIVRTPVGLVAGGTGGMIATLEAPTATQAVPTTSVVAGTTLTPFIPVTAAGGHAPYSYTVSPLLPVGVGVNPATGQISGTPVISASTAPFAGSDNFGSGNLDKWGIFFRFSGTNGELALDNTNGRLQFTKAAGAGSGVRGWDGDPSSAGNRTTASFATSWVADVTVTNTATAGTGEFVTAGIEIASGSASGYSAIMLGNGGYIRAEGAGTAAASITSVPTTGVRLRLAWNATTQILTASFSTDNGATYTTAKTFSPVAEWASGLASSGFFIDLFGNSNAAASIGAGAVHFDNFSVAATSPTTTIYTVAATSAAGLIARNTFALTITPAPSAGTIASFTPDSAAPGATVTIAGTGFTGATAVKFNGVDAASYTVVSDTQITAVVPLYATSGALTITTPLGTIVSTTNVTIPLAAPLVNLSQRGFVGLGENALMANFSIQGASSRTVLVRAGGPALAAFGISGTLADPALTIYDARGEVVATNDDWNSSLATVFASVGAFAFSSGSKDAALSLTLPAGVYTARVTGAGSTTGEALLEVYDLPSSPAGSRFGHLASRARVAPSSPSTAGFVVSGTASRTVLIRAIGTPLVPALGALSNPVLAVFQGSTQIATNDNWTASADLTAATAAVGAMPLGTSDSALLLTLAPGNYTVQVTGSATGFALTEIFLVDGNLAPSFRPALLAPIAGRTFNAGDSIYFSAPTLAKPHSVTYEWRRNGEVVTGTALSGFPNVFFLLSATANDAGTYTLTMTNSAGVTTTAPFTLALPVRHSADYNPGDGAIDLGELLRLIQLYNTRNGTLRTGAYAVSATGEDGFAPDAARSNSAVVTLARYHSADTNRDGKLSLLELTRVIELFNFRSGTVRTGQYRLQSGTEDGFAPGP